MTASILVIEDNPDSRKLVDWILDDAGYQVADVDSAEKAMTALETRTFDLLLMDISLPGMDGKEATEAIAPRSPFARVPVLAVTAHAVKEEERDIWASGVTAIVTKPIDEKCLLDTIESLLSGGRP